jgi:hypothetical protein
MRKYLSFLVPYLLAFLALGLSIPQGFSQSAKGRSSIRLENSITAAYLQKNLPRKSTKLIHSYPSGGSYDPAEAEK